MSTDPQATATQLRDAGWNPSEYLARAAAFDAKTITDALALAGAIGYDEMRAVIATLPGFQNAEISNDRLTATALGILSEYTRQIVTMYQRAEARVAELEAEIGRLAQTASYLDEKLAEEHGLA